MARSQTAQVLLGIDGHCPLRDSRLRVEDKLEFGLPEFRLPGLPSTLG